MGTTEPRRGKIGLSIGNMSFSGEGDQEWLDQQIDKLIATVAREPYVEEDEDDSSRPEPTETKVASTESLASYLKAKNGLTVQNQRFLATAGWLHHRGEDPLTTRAVSKALQDNQQKRLGNPADCLNKNVGRGFCEKTNEGFFITPEGWNQLGEGEDT